MEKKASKAAQLAKELLYQPKLAADAAPDAAEAAQKFCEGYKAFLNESKTEREAVTYCEQLLLQKGYQPFCPGTRYPAGFKVYAVNRGKNILAATIGSQPADQGFHIVAAHIDSPRLDLKPLPLYEESSLALLKTHYYGGVRKYQWTALPLALHGVFCRPGGETVRFCVGEEEGDPVFCITDLLPHLGAEQGERKLKDGIRGEELNILVGGTPVADETVKERVKLYTMQLLHEKYGIVEGDFIRAEIEAVPAHKARDIGFDRSMVGAYGQDDRVHAYTALMAEIETRAPHYTTVCVLADKEETGSDGVTGLQGEFAFNFLRQLCAGQGADPITAFRASRCLSADATAAYDPTFASAFEKQNCAFAGRGVSVMKYTGARGKSSTNDAPAELVGYLLDILDESGVVWQTGEIGRVDLGGGGTVAKFVADRDIDTIDIGVPVLSLHAPFEAASKNDVYMAYRAFKAFNESLR